MSRDTFCFLRIFRIPLTVLLQQTYPRDMRFSACVIHKAMRGRSTRELMGFGRFHVFLDLKYLYLHKVVPLKRCEKDYIILFSRRLNTG